LPENAATKGMIMKRFNYDSGEFVDYIRTEAVAGRPPFTRSPSAARWPGNDEFYLFGGSTLSGEKPSAFWHGVQLQQQEEIIYQWREVTGPHPQGRTGAILVADVERNRLLLLFGDTTTGTTDEVFSYDRGSETWSSVSADIPDLGPVSNAGFAVSEQFLYLYGGENEGITLEGVWAINLGTLTGYRLDTNAGVGPGPRSGTAVFYDTRGRLLYVFGGKDNNGLRNDLWRFDLNRERWELLSPDGSSGSPAPMTDAALVVSPGDGSVSVLAGPLEDPDQPMWQLRLGSWYTWEELLVPKED
jgi:hypothetical protein